MRTSANEKLTGKETCYNTGEAAYFDVATRYPAFKKQTPELVHPAPVYFRYSFSTGRSQYLFANRPKPTAAVEKFVQLLEEQHAICHPFTLHLVAMLEIVQIRNGTIKRHLQTLIAVENELLVGSLISMQVLNNFKNYTQKLHELSRALIMLEHYNERDLANLSKLLKDMDRLERVVERVVSKGAPKFSLNAELHHRTRDGFLCLQDFCSDRGKRIRNWKERVQNLIALVIESR